MFLISSEPDFQIAILCPITKERVETGATLPMQNLLETHTVRGTIERCEQCGESHKWRNADVITDSPTVA